MPSKTRKQQRFMAMCSTPKGRKKAKGKCPPQDVAMEYRHLADDMSHTPKRRKRK